MELQVSADEDLQHVERVLAGDASAFEGIVRRWQGPLINLAYRFCRDRSRAEEWAQEAFLRSYRSLSSWRRDAAFSTWLFALAMNVYRSELKRLPPTALSMAEIAEPPDARATSDRMESAERERALRRALLALPQKYREALTLFYFHEMDVSAAARTLQLPEGTVKVRLFRGREMLRSKLQKILHPSNIRETP